MFKKTCLIFKLSEILIINKLSTTRYCWRDLNLTLELIIWNLATTPPFQLDFLLRDLCPISFMTSKYTSINMQMTQVSSLFSPAIACPINSVIWGSGQMLSMIGISLTLFNWIHRNPKSCSSAQLAHLKTLSSPSSINVAGTLLPSSTTLKFLGVTFDSHLSFKEHSTSIVKSCNHLI